MDEVPVQAAELKPLSLSELLDRTFTLYRNRFWLFCGIMVIPEIAIMICSLIVVVAFPIKMVSIAQSSQDPFAVFRTFQDRIVPSFLLIIAQLFFQAFALGAVTVAVSELYLGRAVSIRGAYRMIRGKIFGLIGLIILLFLISFVFLVGVFVAVGLVGGIASVALTQISPILSVIAILLLALGGFVLAAWLLMRFAVSIPVFLLEQHGAVESMTRSGVLTRGNRGRILGAVLVMYIVSFVVQSLFVLPFSILAFTYAVKGLLPVWIQAGQSVAAAIAGTVAGPLFMITIALIYYDVRIRKEAFDLESMMTALNTSANTGGDASAPPPLQPAS
jgi:Membrane domain of glycerophosphoryl diester phosphodiesterase